MRRTTLLLLATALAVLAPAGLPVGPAPAHADDRAEASRHFQLGVRLYAEGKYSEALIEFQRAYELSPHPSVLYNLAATNRELSRYGESIQLFERFLSEGRGVIASQRLARARAELEDVRARIATVLVDVQPAGVTVTVDGRELGATPLAAPVLLGPGRHTFVLRAPWDQTETRSVTLASGDRTTLSLAMVQPAPPDVRPGSGAAGAAPGGSDAARPPGVTAEATPAARARGSMGVSASFATNARHVAEIGAPELGAHLRLGRVVLGADLVLVAWAVVPSLRVHLAGDRVALHAIAAVPVNIADGGRTDVFVAGAAGLGLRVWAASSLAIRVEALASVATGGRGFNVPVSMGVELWR